jgi:hypothetical protein
MNHVKNKLCVDKENCYKCYNEITNIKQLKFEPIYKPRQKTNQFISFLNNKRILQYQEEELKPIFHKSIVTEEKSNFKKMPNLEFDELEISQFGKNLINISSDDESIKSQENLHFMDQCMMKESGKIEISGNNNKKETKDKKSNKKSKLSSSNNNDNLKKQNMSQKTNTEYRFYNIKLNSNLHDIMFIDVDAFYKNIFSLTKSRNKFYSNDNLKIIKDTLIKILNSENSCDIDLLKVKEDINLTNDYLNYSENNNPFEQVDNDFNNLNTITACFSIEFTVEELDKQSILKNTNRLIRFPIYLGKDTYVYSDSIDKSTTNFEEKNPKIDTSNYHSYHSEIGLISGLKFDLKRNTDSYVLGDLKKYLMLYLKKGVVKSIIVNQVFLEIYSSRIICNKCRALLNLDHTEIVDLIIGCFESTAKSVDNNILVKCLAKALYKDVSYSINDMENDTENTDNKKSKLFIDYDNPRIYCSKDFLNTRYYKQTPNLEIKIIDHETREEKLIFKSKSEVKIDSKGAYKARHIMERKTFFLSELINENLKQYKQNRDDIKNIKNDIINSQSKEDFDKKIIQLIDLIKLNFKLSLEKSISDKTSNQSVITKLSIKSIDSCYNFFKSCRFGNTNKDELLNNFLEIEIKLDEEIKKQEDIERQNRERRSIKNLIAFEINNRNMIVRENAANLILSKYLSNKQFKSRSSYLYNRNYYYLLNKFKYDQIIKSFYYDNSEDFFLNQICVFYLKNIGIETVNLDNFTLPDISSNIKIFCKNNNSDYLSFFVIENCKAYIYFSYLNETAVEVFSQKYNNNLIKYKIEHKNISNQYIIMIFCLQTNNRISNTFSLQNFIYNYSINKSHICKVETSLNDLRNKLIEEKNCMINEKKVRVDNLVKIIDDAMNLISTFAKEKILVHSYLLRLELSLHSIKIYLSQEKKYSYMIQGDNGLINNLQLLLSILINSIKTHNPNEEQIYNVLRIDNTAGSKYNTEFANIINLQLIYLRVLNKHLYSHISLFDFKDIKLNFTFLNSFSSNKINIGKEIKIYNKEIDSNTELDTFLFNYKNEYISSKNQKVLAIVKINPIYKVLENSNYLACIIIDDSNITYIDPMGYPSDIILRIKSKLSNPNSSDRELKSYFAGYGLKTLEFNSKLSKILSRKSLFSFNSSNVFILKELITRFFNNTLNDFKCTFNSIYINHFIESCFQKIT